jgi:glycosyltransferase involved in cell wall biosynthesis
MLSILIPVFNFDVTKLVSALHRQCSESGIESEIVCCDDASENSFRQINSKLVSLSNITYRQLETNQGRSRIRNLLAREAKFENLLFMDCDSEVVSGSYIREYLQHCNSEKVICGGRVYDTSAPKDKKKILRWKTGRCKEEFSAEERNRSPYRSFMTNNFLIPKQTLLENPLDESVSGYGHEDTLLGFQLGRKNIPVLHIDNPLKHIGLEDAEEFLSKTENGIGNLVKLWRGKKLTPDELKHIPLMRTFLNLQKCRLDTGFLFVFRSFSGIIRSNLLSENPSVRFFDFYKLGVLCSRAQSGS